MCDFYPRPPRGGRQRAVTFNYRNGAFLSTPSARRATATTTVQDRAITISIHALREEGDKKTVSRNVTALRFLSTPSARRATAYGGGMA